MSRALVEDHGYPLISVPPETDEPRRRPPRIIAPRHILESPKPLDPKTLEQIWAGYRAWLADPTAVLILQDGVRFRTLNPDGTITPEITVISEANPRRLWPLVLSAIGGVVIGFVAGSGLA